FSHSAATFLSSSALLAASTTLAPAPASVFAASAPKAPDAPVMMAVLPLMSNSGRGLFRNASDMGPSRVLVHGRAWPGHLRFWCSVAAKAWMPEQVQRHDAFARHLGGLATATTIEHTSLPRLMISRVSFGSITQESLAFKTVSLPLTMTVNSPRNTK